MKISILGTGMVGQTIATKMKDLNHEVFMGTRDASSTLKRTDINQMTGQSFSDWLSKNREVQLLDYAALPAETDVFINATSGKGSIEALKKVGSSKLEGKPILDISNPLDFSKGMPPTLFISNTDSLAEKIQRTFSSSNVVKSLNTMNCYLMVNPQLVPGDHNVFMSGDDPGTKKMIRSLLIEIGWDDNAIIDLGDISTARGVEMVLPLWLNLMGKLGTAQFNFRIAN